MCPWCPRPVVSGASNALLEEEVTAILDFPLPSACKKLHEFLGLVNFTIGSSRTV